jgi:phage baseplate assembly protein W
MANTTTVYGRVIPARIKQEVINSNSSQEVFGVKFPLVDTTANDRGIFNKTKGLELLKSEVRQFIKTERGERVMLPNYGLSLKKFVFEPVTDELVENIQNEITWGFAQYLPKAKILNISVLTSEFIGGIGLPGLKISVTIADRNQAGTATVEVTL